MSSISRINAQKRRVDTVARSSLNVLFPLDRPQEDVVVTCGTAQQRAGVFYHVLYRAVTAGMPAIVLYSSSDTEQQLRKNRSTIFIGPDRPYYMPLLGMTEIEALTILCPTEKRENSEWEALKLYLHLLVRLGLPVSLRHLYWLVHLEQDPLTAYLNSVGTLPEQERQAVLTSVKPYYGGSPRIIDFVRKRIEGLELEATRLGIFNAYEQSRSCTSILRAIRSNSLLAIRLNDPDAKDPDLELLCSELRLARADRKPFLLACCDMIIPEGTTLAKQIQEKDLMTTFLSMGHGPNAFPSQRQDYWRGMMKGSLLVLNCSDETASAYEELFGTYPRIKTTYTSSHSRQTMRILGTNSRTRITTEEFIPKIQQLTLTRNPNGGVFHPSGTDRLLVIGDLGL